MVAFIALRGFTEIMQEFGFFYSILKRVTF